MNPNDTTPEDNTEAPSPTPKTPFIVITVFLILIITIASLSFVAWRALREETEQLRQQTSALLDDAHHTNLHIETLEKSVRDKLFAQEQTLQKLQASLSKQPGQSEDWLMDESRHLIRLANYTLQAQKNIPLAIKLLSLASDNVLTLENPKALPLKQSINDDLAALKSVSFPNEETLYLQLNTLDKLIAKLPFPQLEKPTLQTSKLQDSSWQNTLKANMKKLRDLVVIRRYTQNAPTALSNKQLSALYHNLHLHLATAQYALMQKNQTIYQQSLSQLQTWVDTYFDKKNETTEQVLLLTKKLANITIAPAIPILHLPAPPNKTPAPISPTPPTPAGTTDAVIQPAQEAMQL